MPMNEFHAPPERCGTCRHWAPITFQDPDNRKYVTSTMDGDCNCPLPVPLPLCLPRHTVCAFKTGCPCWEKKS